MSATKLFTRVLPVVLVALLVGACSDLESPSAPEMSAQFGIGPVTRAGGPGTLVERTAPAVRDSVYATIDARGGELRVGGHILSVPRRAVTAPTVFVMRVLEGNYIHVDLSAVTVATGAEVTEFGTEVKLRLSWSQGNVADSRALRVAYLLDNSANGRQELLKTVVDVRGRFVDTKLEHFSQYAIAFD